MLSFFVTADNFDELGFKIISFNLFLIKEYFIIIVVCLF
jgi:hypothetical protein